MDSKLSVPLLTPSTRYSEWKMKMIASMKREDIYEVSIGLVKGSYQNENEWINEGVGSFGAIGLALSPILRYLTKSV